MQVWSRKLPLNQKILMEKMNIPFEKEKIIFAI